MHAEEVHFGHLDADTIYHERDRNSCDKSAQLALAPDANDPVRDITGWIECPSQEVNRVVESEFAFIVFDVVIRQQRVYLIGLLIAAKIDCNPLISVG